MTDFSYRIFRQENETLLAISDSFLVGKKFEEGELQIDVSREFYHEKNCDADEALTLIKGATIVNAVGKNITGLMLERRMIDAGMVLVISGVPHAQVVVVK